MAWPLTPLTSYVAASVPAIKASDLNAIQDAINRAFLGTYSYKGIVVDGTGGAVVAPTAGTLTTSDKIVAGTVLVPTSRASGASIPTSAYSVKSLYADNIVGAYVKFTYSGGSGGTFTILRAFNVASITRTGVGSFEVDYVSGLSTGGAADLVGSVNVRGSASVAGASVDANAADAQITTYGSSGSAADPTGSTLFNLLVIGLGS